MMMTIGYPMIGVNRCIDRSSGSTLFVPGSIVLLVACLTADLYMGRKFKYKSTLFVYRWCYLL